MVTEGGDELVWVESIHGSLVVVPLERLDQWELVERGSALDTTPLVADVLSEMPAAGGVVWVLAEQALVVAVPTADGVVLVQPLGRNDLEGDDAAVYELVDGVPETAWRPAGPARELEQGVAVFDACVPDEEAIEEFGALVGVEPGTYRVEVAPRYAAGGVVAHLVRFRHAG